MNHKIRDFDVSIVVPVYNRQDTISDSLRSLLVQTIPPSEVIVINDGSTDDTETIVNERLEVLQEMDEIKITVQVEDLHPEGMETGTIVNIEIPNLD